MLRLAINKSDNDCPVLRILLYLLCIMAVAGTISLFKLSGFDVDLPGRVQPIVTGELEVGVQLLAQLPQDRRHLPPSVVEGYQLPPPVHRAAALRVEGGLMRPAGGVERGGVQCACLVVSGSSEVRPA